MTQESPLFSFGVVADPQYADIAPNVENGRYYAQSLAKLDTAISTLNDEALAFVVTLGDLIDRDWKSYDDIMPVFEKLRHPKVFLPGNHDFAVDAQHLPLVYARLGMQAPWFVRREQGYRFIVLDGSHVSVFAPPEGDMRRKIAETRLEGLRAANAVNAQTWNGTLGEEQFRWLENTLDEAEQAGEPSIIFCHYPAFPENAHNLWDAPRVLDLLARYRHVIGWFSGHNHDGNFGTSGGKYYVNFKGMVDTRDENTFAIVDVFRNRLEIRGFGREESRTLPL